MRTLIIITITLIFATICFSQSKDEIKQLKLQSADLERLLDEKYNERGKLNTEKDSLRIRYDETHPAVIKIIEKIEVVTNEIENLKKQLSPINEIIYNIEIEELIKLRQENEKKEQQFLKNLPNNQIELLKIIIKQNQEIIRLLRKT
jgi:hypothetical protein